jgi:hypothetical protein
MILRRVIEHVKHQNWTAVALDFIIVVVGVFIGIQLGNWNEERQNHEIGADYIFRLETDLGYEIANWRHLTDYYKNTRRHAVAALDAFDNSNQLDSAFLVDLYQASQQWNVTVLRGAYDELISTGRIVYIEPDDIRRLLANHYERSGARTLILRDNGDFRRVIRERMDYRFQKMVRARCDDDYLVDENNYTYLVLPEKCEIAVAPEAVREETEKLRADEDVLRTLRFHVSLLDSKINSLENAIDTAENTLVSLRGVQQ